MIANKFEAGNGQATSEQAWKPPTRRGRKYVDALRATSESDAYKILKQAKDQGIIGKFWTSAVNAPEPDQYIDLARNRKEIRAGFPIIANEIKARTYDYAETYGHAKDMIKEPDLPPEYQGRRIIHLVSVWGVYPTHINPSARRALEREKRRQIHLNQLIKTLRAYRDAFQLFLHMDQYGPNTTIDANRSYIIGHNTHDEPSDPPYNEPIEPLCYSGTTIVHYDIDNFVKAGTPEDYNGAVRSALMRQRQERAKEANNRYWAKIMCNRKQSRKSEAELRMMNRHPLPADGTEPAKQLRMIQTIGA